MEYLELVPKVSLSELTAHACPLTQHSGILRANAVAEAKGSLRVPMSNLSHMCSSELCHGDLMLLRWKTLLWGVACGRLTALLQNAQIPLNISQGSCSATGDCLRGVCCFQCSVPRAIQSSESDGSWKSLGSHYTAGPHRLSASASPILLLRYPGLL